MGEAVYQFLILLAVVIGAFGKLPVHALDVRLHLEDVLKGKFRLLHHGALVTEYHHLRQVADGALAGNGDNAGSGLLDACQYLEHGGLARAVLADKGYAVFLVDDIGNVFEQGGGIELHLQSFYSYHSVNGLIV